MAVHSFGKRQNLLLLAAVLSPFLLSVFAHAAGSQPRAVSVEPKPSLAFSQYLVDKGQVDPTAQENAQFAFVNSGTEPIEITKVKASCGCLQPVVWVGEQRHRPNEDGRLSLKIKPGEQGRIVLRVQMAGQEPGAKEFTVTVDSRDRQEHSRELVFRIDLPERGVYLDRSRMVLYQRTGVATTEDVLITDMRDDVLSIEGIQCTSDLVQAEVLQPQTNSDGFREFPIRLTVSGDVPPGKHEVFVRIFTNDADYPELRVTLWIFGSKAAAEKTATGNQHTQQ